MLREWRTTFDRVAELYDRARPTYQQALFDDIVALSGIPDGGRVLEIGCGTGQATLPMASAGIASRRWSWARTWRRWRGASSSRTASTCRSCEFEEWPLPEEPFDLVTCVSAFHWLDADVALPKMARALRPGGAIAIAGGGHVEGGTSQFFVEVQDCYEAHMPGTPPGPAVEDGRTRSRWRAPALDRRVRALRAGADAALRLAARLHDADLPQ